MNRKQYLAAKYENKTLVSIDDSDFFEYNEDEITARVSEINSTYELYRRRFAILKMNICTDYIDDTVNFESATDIEQQFWVLSAKLALKLTPKQRDILAFMLNNVGLSKKSVAKQLSLKPQALHKHLTLIQTKIEKVFTSIGLKEVFADLSNED